MKTLHSTAFMITLFLFIGVTSAHAQDISRSAAITKTQANEFYESCLAQNYPAKSLETSEAFCACSSARFFKQLRQGDLLDIRFEDTWQARRAKEKLLAYVYTPCIRDSLNTLIYEECQQNTDLDNYTFLDKRTFCGCQARRMEIVYKQSSGQIAEQNKKNLDGSLSDPIGSFMQNGSYLEQSSAVTGLCMKKATIEIDRPEPVTLYSAPLSAVRSNDHDHDHSHGSSNGRPNIQFRPLKITDSPLSPKE